MTRLTLDAVQCLLMADVAARMYYYTRGIFWRTLPDIVPDVTAHLPALTSAVRDETNASVLEDLSFHPLPATLPPERPDWRQGLVTAWEKQLKAAREATDRRMDRRWEDGYISALRGLTRVDGCGMPSGETCRSVLPILLNEARDIQKRFRRMTTEMASTVSFGSLYEQHLECLSALAGWRPAPNVLTDPADLKAWGEFWLELYQSGEMTATDRKPDDAIIRKGIGAKALLNLLETNDKTGVPAGMETLLLESLTRAIDVAGKTPRNNYSLGWLSWQPQDVTRFPTDQLATFPKALLEKVRLLCQEPDNWWDGKLQRPLAAAMEELVRWEQGGLLAVCHIDLTACVLTDMRRYLDNCMNRHAPSANSMNYELYRWFIRDEVAALKDGRELLEKLENHWQYECKSEYSDWYSKFIAWKGRIELQRIGLALQTPDVFHKNLLEAIKNEKYGEVRLALSLQRLEKDMPDRVRRTGEYLWQEGLKSDNDEIGRIAALALLRPDPDDDPAVRRQKLQDIICAMPENRRPKLSIAEITNLMGNLPLGKGDIDAGQSWQFRTGGVSLHVHTEGTPPSVTRMIMRTGRQDRTM